MPWAYLKKVDLADRYKQKSTGMEGLSVSEARCQQKAELTIMTGMKRDSRKPTFVMLVVLPHTFQVICVTLNLQAG